MAAYEPRRSSVTPQQIYGDGFIDGWTERSTVADRLDADARLEAYVDGLAEGIRIGQDANGTVEKSVRYGR
jgi:hypothetical protein